MKNNELWLVVALILIGAGTVMAIVGKAWALALVGVGAALAVAVLLW